MQNLMALSARLGRNLIVFDIEHTGGKKIERGITEFACLVVTDSKVTVGIDTLVNPGKNVFFNPYAMRITKIGPKTVQNAPPWHPAVSSFVLDHQECVWVGFNSKASDLPVIRDEHARFGLPVPKFRWHLDVMTLAAHSTGRVGKLQDLVLQWVPGALESKAHRAMADVRMTAALTDVILPRVSDRFFLDAGLIAKEGKKTEPTGMSECIQEGACSTATGRRESPWSPEEDAQVQDLFFQDFSIQQISAQMGRSSFAIALRLVKHSLLLPEEAEAYRSV